jgi:hypothetical protein
LVGGLTVPPDAAIAGEVRLVDSSTTIAGGTAIPLARKARRSVAANAQPLLSIIFSVALKRAMPTPAGKGSPNRKANKPAMVGVPDMMHGSSKKY